MAGPAPAQILRGLGGGLNPALPLPNVGSTVDEVLDRTKDDLTPVLNDTLNGVSPSRLRDLVRANPRALDLDANGAAVVRGEVLAIAPTPASLAIAAKAGFTVIRETRLASLDLDLVSLSPPKGVSAREGLSRLRALDASGQYDLDHIYTGAGEAGGGANPPAPPEGAATPAPGARVGLLDTGIDRDHPAFRASSVEQKGFAPGGVRPGAHGTAVASLMIGKARRFRGAAPGAALLVGDVYGDGPTGGSAYAIAGGLAWMAERKMPVVNISLVGPPNLTLEAAVRAAVARGILIVAPVGNDGPAAPALYPAAYPGVIAVTGVDARGKVLIEAGRAGHIDFRAPGADITAADAGGGYEDVRGTSFASPIVAGALALRLLRPDRAAAMRAVADLSTQAARDGGVVGADLIAADRWPR